jgi:hypothetical protein
MDKGIIRIEFYDKGKKYLTSLSRHSLSRSATTARERAYTSQTNLFMNS